jgi:hypothetical protein
MFVSTAQKQEVYFVSNAHHKGFAILETNVYTGEDGHEGMHDTYDRTVNALHFYDIRYGNLTTLLSMEEGKVCTFTEQGGYFVTATEKVYRYKVMFNKGDELRRSECALYTIGGGGEPALLYTFDGELIDSDFTRQIIPTADGIYLEADILHKGGVFKSWGNGVYTYLLDLETESLKKTNDVPFYDEAKKGFTFCRSLYYINELYLDGDGWYAYEFIRRDTITGKEEVLQCWCDNDYGYYDDLDVSGDAIDLGKGKIMRFSEKMWAQYLVEDYNYYACPFPDDYIIRTK